LREELRGDVREDGEGFIGRSRLSARRLARRLALGAAEADAEEALRRRDLALRNELRNDVLRSRALGDARVGDGRRGDEDGDHAARHGERATLRVAHAIKTRARDGFRDGAEALARRARALALDARLGGRERRDVRERDFAGRGGGRRSAIGRADGRCGCRVRRRDLLRRSTSPLDTTGRCSWCGIRAREDGEDARCASRRDEGASPARAAAPRASLPSRRCRHRRILARGGRPRLCPRWRARRIRADG
jgi:hypothetical protein